MSDNYLALVNKLRNRYNEPVLTTGTWGSTVGFDQFTKEAINYAYHDILNAEMQWPFLHQAGSFTTTPGVQFYTPSVTPPTGFTSPAEIKEIDWDKFYTISNETITTISNEAKTIPLTAPYTVAPTNVASWQTDLGVKFTVGSVALTPVIGDPTTGQYSITGPNTQQGVYIFAAADAGKAIQISYTTAVIAVNATVETAQFLQYIDYDFWCQAYLSRDLNALVSAYAKPTFVFKTQKQGEIGISPVPDKIYTINYEYWLDGLDLSATTDVPLLPSHFNQILLDGAQKYCFEFREDAQMAQLADARLKAGITRMRIELINRNDTMKSGFTWGAHGGFTYTLSKI